METKPLREVLRESAAAEVRNFKVFQAVEDSNGQPDFFFCKVRCTQEDFDNGEHFDIVSRKAEEQGYSPFPLYYDENCPAGRAMMHLFEWDTASTFTV